MPHDAEPWPGNRAEAPLRPLTHADLRWAADLHGRELADGFLPRLGARFLRQYLRTFLETPGAVALAASGTDGTVVGYVVGSTTPAHNRVALQRHWRRLLPPAAAAPLRRPSLTWTFLRTRASRYVRVATKVARRRPAAGQDHAPGSTHCRPAPRRRRAVLARARSGRGPGGRLRPRSARGRLRARTPDSSPSEARRTSTSGRAGSCSRRVSTTTSGPSSPTVARCDTEGNRPQVAAAARRRVADGSRLSRGR